MKQHTIFYGSSYDRGLQFLLGMWADILKEFPNAKLHIAYGWDLFDRAFHNNPERQAWKQKMEELMTQKGITHHGRVGKQELKKIRSECGIWAYPTNFDEINCITALDSQLSGCVPVVVNRAALKETVQSGVKIEGDIYSKKVQKEYLDALIGLMKDEKKWKDEKEKGMKFAQGYAWEKIALEWSKHFK